MLSKLTKILVFNFFILCSVSLTQSCKILPQPLPTYDIAKNPDKTGWYIFVNGKYRGGLTNGVPEGKGEYIYNNGIRYEGTFSNGEIQGYGVLNIPDYGIVKGNFHEGLIQYGEIEYKDGNFFSGSFSYGKKYEGIFIGKTFAYSGRFENEIYVGKGLYIDYQTGIVYKGNFNNGQKDGESIEYSLKNENAIYKKYSNGVDLTNNIYNELATKELNLEFKAEQDIAKTKVRQAKDKFNYQKEKIDSITVKMNNYDKDFSKSITEECKCVFLNIDQYNFDKSNPTLDSAYMFFFKAYLLSSQPNLTENEISYKTSAHAQEAFKSCYSDVLDNKQESTNLTKYKSDNDNKSMTESNLIDERSLTIASIKENPYGNPLKEIVYTDGTVETILSESWDYEKPFKDRAKKIINYSNGVIKTIYRDGHEGIEDYRAILHPPSQPELTSISLSNDFKKDIELKYNEELKNYCNFAIQDTVVAKKNLLDQINNVLAAATQERQKLDEEYGKRIREQSELVAQQERTKTTIIQQKIATIAKGYNEKATNEFKSYKSTLTNTAKGCSCACIALSTVRPDQEKMRGCPK